MIYLRAFLVVIFLSISIYTALVVSQHGIGLLAVFFGDMALMAWPGQFNFDFMCMLALSALWVGWRHAWSAAGCALALLAFFGGALFLSLYLLIESYRGQGSVQVLLLGSTRAKI